MAHTIPTPPRAPVLMAPRTTRTMGTSPDSAGAPASLARPRLPLLTLAAILLAASTTAARAQPALERPSVRSRIELLVSSGALLPTGEQRNALGRANMTIAQLAFAARPYLAVTTSAGWARSRDLTTADSPRLDVFTYDAGLELRADKWLSGRTLTFTPFAGAGAGGRSYNHRRLELDATHNLAAYGSAGGELGYRRVRFRLEARDYLTGFKPLAGGGTSTRRNDVTVMAGLRIAAR